MDSADAQARTGAARAALLYVLHSGELFGTERMALATLAALRAQFDGVLIAPPGPVHGAAAALEIASTAARGRASMLAAIGRQLWRRPDAAVITTGVWQAVAAVTCQRALGGRGAQLHVVHGGTAERLSYGRKRWLARLPVRIVAISEFVRSRLLAHDVPDACISVVHNFLPSSAAAPCPAKRPPFVAGGIRRVVMLSRLDRIKRVGLLFDALERHPALRELQFDIYGSGEEAQALQHRAAGFPNVRLHGFVPDAARALGAADLLLHTCPEEPFGLVLLEAFAAGVPVLVPNAGGACEVVEDGVSGVHFAANDPVDLGRRLQALAECGPDVLNDLVLGGRRALWGRFDAAIQAGRYARLVRGAA